MTLLRSASIWAVFAAGAVWIVVVGYLEARLVGPALKRILANPPPGDYLLTKAVPGWKPLALGALLVVPPGLLVVFWLWARANR